MNVFFYVMFLFNLIINNVYNSDKKIDGYEILSEKYKLEFINIHLHSPLNIYYYYLKALKNNNKITDINKALKNNNEIPNINNELKNNNEIPNMISQVLKKNLLEAQKTAEKKEIIKLNPDPKKTEENLLKVLQKTQLEAQKTAEQPKITAPPCSGQSCLIKKNQENFKYNNIIDGYDKLNEEYINSLKNLTYLDAYIKNLTNLDAYIKNLTDSELSKFTDNLTFIKDLDGIKTYLLKNLTSIDLMGDCLNNLIKLEKYLKGLTNLEDYVKNLTTTEKLTALENLAYLKDLMDKNENEIKEIEKKIKEIEKAIEKNEIYNAEEVLKNYYSYSDSKTEGKEPTIPKINPVVIVLDENSEKPATDSLHVKNYYEEIIANYPAEVKKYIENKIEQERIKSGVPKDDIIKNNNLRLNYINYYYNLIIKNKSNDLLRQANLKKNQLSNQIENILKSKIKKNEKNILIEEINQHLNSSNFKIKIDLSSSSLEDLKAINNVLKKHNNNSSSINNEDNEKKYNETIEYLKTIKTDLNKYNEEKNFNYCDADIKDLTQVKPVFDQKTADLSKKTSEKSYPELGIGKKIHYIYDGFTGERIELPNHILISEKLENIFTSEKSLIAMQNIFNLISSAVSALICEYAREDNQKRYEDGDIFHNQLYLLSQLNNSRILTDVIPCNLALGYGSRFSSLFGSTFNDFFIKEENLNIAMKEIAGKNYNKLKNNLKKIDLFISADNIIEDHINYRPSNQIKNNNSTIVECFKAISEEYKQLDDNEKEYFHKTFHLISKKNNETELYAEFFRLLFPYFEKINIYIQNYNYIKDFLRNTEYLSSQQKEELFNLDEKYSKIVKNIFHNIFNSLKETLYSDLNIKDAIELVDIKNSLQRKNNIIFFSTNISPYINRLDTEKIAEYKKIYNQSSKCYEHKFLPTIDLSKCSFIDSSNHQYSNLEKKVYGKLKVEYIKINFNTNEIILPVTISPKDLSEEGKIIYKTEIDKIITFLNESEKKIAIDKIIEKSNDLDLNKLDKIIEKCNDLDLSKLDQNSLKKILEANNYYYDENATYSLVDKVEQYDYDVLLKNMQNYRNTYKMTCKDSNSKNLLTKKEIESYFLLINDNLYLKNLEENEFKQINDDLNNIFSGTNIKPSLEKNEFKQINDDLNNIFSGTNIKPSLEKNENKIKINYNNNGETTLNLDIVKENLKKLEHSAEYYSRKLVFTTIKDTINLYKRDDTDPEEKYEEIEKKPIKNIDITIENIMKKNNTKKAEIEEAIKSFKNNNLEKIINMRYLFNKFFPDFSLSNDNEEIIISYLEREFKIRDFIKTHNSSWQQKILKKDLLNKIIDSSNSKNNYSNIKDAINSIFDYCFCDANEFSEFHIKYNVAKENEYSL